MNLPKWVVVMMLVAVSRGAADSTSSSKQNKEESSNTEKRALVEGNAGVGKRAPVLADVSSTSSPGIVYADATESHSEKSPTQQIYATPVPQLAKISDVLTGQGPPFPVAITSHLFSPVSAYQPRFAAPATYEISAPVPSQLAYAEHKIAYPAPQNVLQYNLQRPIQQLPNYQDLRQTDHRINFSYQQSIPQSTNVQTPSVVRLYSQQQDQIQPQQFQGLPQVGYQFQFPAKNLPQPIYYTQPSQVDPRNQIQHPFVYSHGNIIPQLQPGITYAIQGKTAPETVQKPDKRLLVPQQDQHRKQGAFSYASFSQSLPSQPAQHQYNGQQYIPVKIEPATNIASLPVRPLPSNPHREISYFRPGPLLPPLQPHFIQQPQIYSQGSVQNPSYQSQSIPIAPVQYYGKYSQPVFG